MKRTHSCQLNFIHPRQQPNAMIWQILRRITTISEYHPLTRMHFRSSFLIEKEKNRHVYSENWFSIHPFSIFTYIWRVIMMFVYGIVIITDIFNVTVHDVWLNNQQWEFTYSNYEVIFNFIYFIDIILHFFTGFVVQKKKIAFLYASGYQMYRVTEIEFDKKKTAKHYVKTFFFADITTLDVFFYYVHRSIYDHLNLFDLHVLIRLLRIVRLHTIKETIQLVTTQIYKHQSKSLPYNILLPFVVYILSCLFVTVPVLSRHLYKSNREYYVQLLIRKHKDLSIHLSPTSLIIIISKDVFEILMGDYYFSINNKCVEDIILYWITLFLGALYRIWFFVTLITTLNIKYRSTLTFNKFVNSLEPYMSYKDINNQAQQYIMKNIRSNFKLEMFAEQTLLNTLGKRIIYEIFTQSSMNLLRNCHLFKKLPGEHISSLALKLKRETYNPGQLVIKVGDLANCMYFIASGTVAVYKDGKEICHLSDGEYIGEIGLLYFTGGRIANVLTIEFTVLYRLDVKDFKKIVKPTSKMYRRIRRCGLRRKNQS